MGGKRKRRLRRIGVGCGALFLLLTVTLSIWVRDEPPSDFSDLEPRYKIEVPAGALTVVDGLEAILPKLPPIPALIEEMELELNFSFYLKRVDSLPAQVRESKELREALQKFFAAGRAQIPKLEEALQRRYFEHEKVDLFYISPIQLGGYDLMKFEMTMALAAQWEGDCMEASRAYGRLLRLTRRWREEQPGFRGHFSSLTLESVAWAYLEELRREGPLDPSIEEEWLTRPQLSPPNGIDLPERLRQKFDEDRRIYESIADESTLFDRWTFKKNRTLRLIAERVRWKIARVERGPDRRFDEDLDPPPNVSAWESLSNSDGKQFFDFEVQLDSILGSVDRNRMIREAGRLLLAFDRYQREHRSLPPDLSALFEAIPALDPVPIDTYSGKPFLYDPDRRIFWSVGEDGASQGATVMPDRAAGVDPWRLADPTWVIPEVAK